MEDAMVWMNKINNTVIVMLGLVPLKYNRYDCIFGN